MIGMTTNMRRAVNEFVSELVCCVVARPAQAAEINRKMPQPTAGPRVVRAVEDLMAPVFDCPGAGQESGVELGDPNLAVTALFENGGEVWARGYRIPGRPSKQFRNWEIFNAPLHTLKGQR
jgi:hypothetical protein